MGIELSPENERFIDTAVQSGEFTDRAAAVNDAVRLMRERQRRLAALREDVRAGIESGDGIPAEAVFDELKLRVRRILTQ